MRNCFLLFGIVVLLSNGSNAQSGNDLNMMLLKGPVKSLEERSWVAETNFGKPVKAGRGEDNANYYFNTSGNFTEKEIYAQTGALQMRYQYQYAKTGLLQRMDLFNRGGVQRHHIIYQYNKQQQLAAQVQHLPDGKETFSYQYQYNGSGKLMGHTWYNANQQKEEVLQNEYDQRGNLIKTSSLNGDGSLATLTFFAYDEKNNLVDEKIYSYGTDGSFRRTAYAYNELNQQTVVNAYVKDSSIFTQTIYTYNEEGLVKSEQHIDEQQRELDLFTYAYQFDSRKNWIKKTAFRNGIPVLITEREIEYYKWK